MMFKSTVKVAEYPDDAGQELISVMHRDESDLFDPDDQDIEYGILAEGGYPSIFSTTLGYLRSTITQHFFGAPETREVSPQFYELPDDQHVWVVMWSRD